MRQPSRLFLLLSVLLSWASVCFAQDAAQSPLDARASALNEARHADTHGLDHHLTDRDAPDNSHEAVQEARKILGRIQPPSQGLVKLSTRNGIVGTTLGYAYTAFDLLFFNAPAQVDFTTSAPVQPAKLGPKLAKAVELLDQVATVHGNPDALWLLGEMNFHGNYTHPRDYPTAFSYYDRLARLDGNASAQHMVGFMYATGIGGSVEQDQAKALLYHTFAADQGDIRSQMTVAYRHHAGIGTPRNCDLAVKYYSQVARRSVEFYKSGPPGGHVLTKNAYRIADELGGYYGEGASVVSTGHNARKGGPGSDAYADIDDVLDYLDLQSKKGDVRASFNLAKLYYDGDRGLDRDMLQAKVLFMQIARSFWNTDGTTKSDASSVVQKLAPRAAGFLGRMFLRGEGVKQSYEKAMIWFKRGLQHGDVLSQYSMGVMYMQGLGVPLDTIKASAYLSAAADSNMAVAQTDLGILFLDQGDVDVARSYFELATNNGHIEAYYYLAEITNQGLGRDRSCGVAASAYKIAAEMAELVHTSFLEANEAYDAGDHQKALVAYMMAAEQGFEHAQSNVAWLLDQSRPLYGLQTLLSRFIPPPPVSARDAALSLIYYTRSARQRNWDSLVKAGDHYLSGLGAPTSEPPASSPDDASTSPPALASNPENAAACYASAAEGMRSAQAMWNLGWMHEAGVGVAQDFHLAKRYYDLALSTDKEAWLSVTLSLLKLRARSWWNDVSGGRVRGIQAEPKEKVGWWDVLRRLVEADQREWDDDELQQEQLRRERGQDGEVGGDFDELDDLDLWEGVVIMGLACVLAGLVFWRQFAPVLAARRQVWPAPDDPDFAPWNNVVGPGGVGG